MNNVNDYIRGVVEALTWVRYLLKKNPDDPEAIDKALCEVAGTLRLIDDGIALKFPEKFKLAVVTQ